METTWPYGKVGPRGQNCGAGCGCERCTWSLPRRDERPGALPASPALGPIPPPSRPTPAGRPSPGSLAAARLSRLLSPEMVPTAFRGGWAWMALGPLHSWACHLTSSESVSTAVNRRKVPLLRVIVKIQRPSSHTLVFLTTHFLTFKMGRQCVLPGVVRSEGGRAHGACQ